MVKQTVEHFGRVDVLFANAGIAHDAPADQLSMDNWQRTIDINLTGVFLCDKYVIQQMLSQGTGGAIVNCGSIHSHVGKAGVTAYASAKGGVKLLTQSMSADYAPKGIRVNAVCPDISILLLFREERKRSPSTWLAFIRWAAWDSRKKSLKPCCSSPVKMRPSLQARACWWMADIQPCK